MPIPLFHQAPTPARNAVAEAHAEVELHALALCPYAEVVRHAPHSAGPGNPHKTVPLVSVGAAGVITRLPRLSKANFKTGDEVWTRLEVVDTKNATRVQLGVEKLFRVPVGVTIEQAATLGDSGLMALTALLEGNILPNRKLLIHGAANPFGSAAIALATFLGAEVYATVDSPHELSFATSAGAVRVAIARSRDEGALLNQWAKPAGFDVIIDGALADHIKLNIDVIANGGQILTCPLMGREGEMRGLQRLASKGGSVRFLATAMLDKYALSDMAAMVNDAVTSGRYRPLVGQIVSPAELDDAITRLERGRVIGNLVLRPSATTTST